MAQAQENLGFAYFTGQGVTTNNAESLKWRLKAAAQGKMIAEYWVGFICMKMRREPNRTNARP